MEASNSDDLKALAEQSKSYVASIATLLDETKRLRVQNHGLVFERDGLLISNGKLTEDVDHIADTVRTQQEELVLLRDQVLALQHRVSMVEQHRQLQAVPPIPAIPSVSHGTAHDADDVWVEPLGPIRGRMPSFPPPYRGDPAFENPILSVPPEDDALC